MEKYKFDSIYRFLDIVSNAVENDVEFWNYNEDAFIESVIKFQKNTLLHIYSCTTLLNYYSEYFKDNEDIIEELDEISDWQSLFEKHDVHYIKHEVSEDSETNVYGWFGENYENFCDLFNVISNEIVHILFSNKGLLVKFNQLVADKLSNESIIPTENLTEKGTIKRCNIPQWVKKAVFHRDKGKCVFCNKDLTGIITTMNATNFDHIIPLDSMGANDPCNIQLSCESCNKSKGAKSQLIEYRYEPLW